MADQSTAIPSDLESYINKLDDALETTIRFFDRNGYFVVTGKDALFFADEIRKTKEILKPHSNGSIGCYAVVSPNQFESEIKEVLLVRQYRIEMHQKDEGVWYKAFDASPGNTGPLEEILYSSQENLESRGLVAISTRGENNPFIGVVYVDDISKVISVAQFQDDANLSMLESFLVQFSPQEALFPDTTATTIRNFVITKLEMNRILPTSCSKEIFNAENGKDALPNILARKLNWDAHLKQVNQIFESMPPTTRNLVLESLSAVVKYLQMAVDTSTSNQYDIKEEQLGMYVKLDSSAVSSLNLFDSSREQSSRGDKKNLFSLLDHCRTPMGRRLLSLWIRQPIVDRKKIEERLNLVEQFVEEIECRSDLNSSKLRGIPDLIQMARKFSNKTVKLGEIFRVYQVTRNLWGFIESLGKDNMYVRELLTKKFEKFVELFDNFNAMVEMLVDEDTTTREYQIKSSYDEELSVLRRELAQVEGHVSKIHRRVASELGVDEKKVKLHSDGRIGYYFSITNALDKKLTEAMKHCSGYEILSNPKKDGIRFAHEDLSGINENFLPLLKDIDAKETQIMAEVRDIVSTYANLVKQLSDLIALVDVYVSLATAACMAPTQYVRPEILEKGSGIIDIKKLRHPCVEQQESLCLDTPYISNDIELKDKQFLIITGPNMGGKSTYIRSIGIAVLMAQMGSFVPAEYAKISIVDGIYTRIGATDRQLLGNSTFMTEMVEMASILRSATNNSLIIIDELGRGTSTFDGFGIAYSVSKHIALELKSYCLFATHYHELTDLEKEVDSVGVLHVAVREPVEGEGDGNITMLYQVRPGKSSRSYGIDVARAANFPADMISVAKRKLEELEASETLVNQLPVDDILKEVGELDLQGMSDEDVESFVSKIRNMVRA